MLRKRLPRRSGSNAPGRLELSEPAQPTATALSTAMGWLAKRDFCSSELAARLVQHGYAAEAVASALAELVAHRYVDDARYAQRWVAIHAARGQGPVRIRGDLQAAGLAQTLVETLLQDYATEHGGWGALAEAVRARRFGRSPPGSAAEWARQARFLQYRGFCNDDIRVALGDEPALGDQPGLGDQLGDMD